MLFKSRVSKPFGGVDVLQPSRADASTRKVDVPTYLNPELIKLLDITTGTYIHCQECSIVVTDPLNWVISVFIALFTCK